MTDTHIAKLMWDAYAIQAGGKTFDGKPLPTWDELGEERQSCWVAAASVAADRIEKLEAALREMLDIVATHRVYVGNSPAGELACEWTMDAIKEIHTKMEEVLDRAALAGEKKDD